jgi:hypothetical protein
VEAIDAASQGVPDDVLLAAAPWFHATHALSPAGAAPPPAAEACDWCGGPAPAPAPGCGACGCARYCGAACAAAAAGAHARNCWRLKRVALPGAALAASAWARPMFEYDEVAG